MQDKRAGHALMDWIRSVPPRRPRIKHEALEGGLMAGISIQDEGGKATRRRGASIPEVAPARHPLDADGDDGQPRDLHGGELL